MPDYSKGKIYKILNTIDDEIYVGSTIKTLSQRMAYHRCHMKRNPHFKLYEHMNKLGVENFYIELIENFPCNDVYEFRAREGHFIREIGTLNKVIAGRTGKEWAEVHKEELKEYHKQYRDEHKECIKEKQKQHYENNKELILEKCKNYYEAHKEQINKTNKQYYEANKEHIKEYKKQHYEKNKEKYMENNKHYKESNKDYINEKITCNICGCQVCRSNIVRHQRTDKCKTLSTMD